MLKFVNKINKFHKINRSIITARQISLSHTNQQQLKTDELEKRAKDDISSAPSSGKLPKRDPFVKNLFLGLIDKEILVFPEVLKKDQIDDLEKSVEKFSASYQHQVCGSKLTQPELISQLKSLNVFASNVSKDYDGRGLTATEYCLYQEKEGNDVNLATKLNVHRVVTGVLEKYGTDDQKERFLRKLASGELIGSVAIFEETVPENGFFNTSAKENNNDAEEWLLNGSKSFVVNCPNATLLVVICQSLFSNRDSVITTGVSAVLVDTTVSKGITVAALDETIGMPNSDQASIAFVNTTVPAANILGKLGHGSEIAMHMLQTSRIQTGVLASTMMKQMINYATEYCNDAKRTGMQLKDNDLMKIRVAKTVCAEYALESMIYLTTGMYDNYDDQDIEVEAAIVKVFAVERALKTATEPFYTFGPGSVLADTTFVENFKNSTQLLAQGETLDSLKIFIALSGLQHAGTDLHDMVTRVRNPMLHPRYVFAKIFSGKNIDNPKATLHLNYNLHPSLDPAAQAIEHSTIRLQISAETLLSRYGAEVVDKTNEVLRLTDATVILYAMYACAARASRAYCIGLHNADYEMLMANTICLDGSAEILALVKDIDRGAHLLNDYNYDKIGKKLFESKKYYLEHPLTRNF